EFEYAPNGILGLETALGLVFTHLFHKKVLTLEQVVEKLSLNPRRILNIPVPEFTVGTVANLTIFSPDEIWSYDLSQTMSKSKNSPFDKTLFTGRSSAVVNKGKLFYKHAFFTV
ncbi:partial Dihydroorotase, partial [Candidatus Brocadiaceae bacterium]